MADPERRASPMNGNVPTVDILLGTYNGASYLAEQLASLEQQTFRSWMLMVRDDGSTDGTMALLAEFQARHPATVTILTDGLGRLGATGNFGRLLEVSTADYGFFCDQDDVWLPTKIEQLLALAATHASPTLPLLVHSDLEVVDRDLRRIAPSLWQFQFIDPAKCEWSRLLVQNVVTGCSCLFNAALRRAVLPIPPAALIHDWWVALVAAAAGKIIWTNATTVRYRQHATNDTGAKRWGFALWLKRARGLFAREQYRQRVRDYQLQAAALARHEAAAIPEPVRVVLREFSTLARRPYFSRISFVRRQHILKIGRLRNLLYLASL